jgi:hypothetical protein
MAILLDQQIANLDITIRTIDVKLGTLRYSERQSNPPTGTNN